MANARFLGHGLRRQRLGGRGARTARVSLFRRLLSRGRSQAGAQAARKGPAFRRLASEQLEDRQLLNVAPMAQDHEYSAQPGATIQVTGTVPALTSGALVTGSRQLAIGFSDSVLHGQAAGNYELRGLGPDGLLGTDDDLMVPFSATSSGVRATLGFTPLGEGVYRLTVRDTITGLSGEAIDGDQDGAPGGDWIADFVVLPSEAGNFEVAGTLRTGAYALPRSVVSADFSGDGVADLVTANSKSDNLTLSLGDGQGGFVLVGDFACGGFSPQGAAVGDFNGDGLKDLAVANEGSGNVGILLGNGAGGLTGVMSHASGGSSPCSVAVGDFNGDGRQDLIVANSMSQNVGVLLGNGRGGFAAAEAYPCGSSPRSVAVGDFDADGNDDVAVANESSQKVSVLLGDGGGGLRAATAYATGGTSPKSVAVGDFNADGKRDLAVANYSSHNVGLLLGDGWGGFAPVVLYATGGSFPDSVAVGDVNGDGIDDLAVTNSNSHNVGVLIADATGGFAEAVVFASGGRYPHSVTVGHFDADGTIDLAVANGDTHDLGVLLNQGAGGFAAGIVSVVGGAYPRSVAVGDFNSDGNEDLAAVNEFTGNVGILLGNGLGGFAAATTYPSGGFSPKSLAVGDFDGDGRQDLAVANSQNVAVLRGNGAGGFAAAVPHATGGTFTSLAVGDFDADGDDDLAVTLYINKVGILLGDGLGGFAALVSYGSGGSLAESVAVGDFNGDGYDDLAVANSFGHNVGVLLNNGAGRFGAAAAYTTGGSTPRSVAVGDLNGDGKKDLLVANSGGNNVGILLGNGEGRFSDAIPVATGGSSPRSVTVGDLNGDGDDDLLVANEASDHVAVLLSDGVGGFGAPVFYGSLYSSPWSVALADLNRDGAKDLVVAHSESCSAGVLLGDGAGRFAAVADYPSGGSSPQSTIVGDFNGDGNADLAVANASANGLGILFGDGRGRFESPVMHATGGSASSVAAGDFNGDGVADLAVANPGSHNVGVLLGDGIGGFSPAVLHASGGSYTDSVAVGDFNGDGDADLAVANAGSHNLGILLGDGQGGFADAITCGSGGYSPRRMAVGDFNGDGYDDLAVANEGSSNVGILLGGRDGSLAVAVPYATGGSGVWAVAVGDFDGDGCDDLAVTSVTTCGLSVLLGDGGGGFSAAVSFPTGGGSKSVSVGDFNADGRQDLAVANEDRNHLAVLLGNGWGGFAAPVAYATGGARPLSVAAGDFDGNGHEDLVAANASSNSLSVFLDAPGRLAVYALQSPQALRFDVQSRGFGAGQLIDGSGGIFDGLGRLEVAGQAYAPVNLGDSLLDGGRTVLTPTAVIAELYISRKITVPTTGNQDFARTLEILTNPTASDITTTVRIVGNLGSGAATTVWTTSSGDAIVEPADWWIGTDADGSSRPAIVHYLHGPGLQPFQVVLRNDNIEWTYQVAVPAGQTVRLAHFTIVAAGRAGAEAAADALIHSTGFADQAAEFLTVEERNSIANFLFNRFPTDISLSSSSIAENLGADALVGSFWTTDLDVGDTFTYNLVPGDGDADNGSFAISGNQLRAAAGFDFEGKSHYTIRVQTTDQGGLAYEEQITIRVADVNEAPTGLSLSANRILENRPAGSIVGAFSTSDPDAGDAFVYELTSGDGDDDNARFTIAGSQLKTAASFDYEGKNRYTIRVQATDKGGLSRDETLAILVDNVNEPPVAHAGGPYTVIEGERILLDASGSSDPEQPDNATLAYQWDLDGDGQFGETGEAASRGDEMGMHPTLTADHLLGARGIPVSLRVRDAEGSSNEAFVLVKVIPTLGPVDYLRLQGESAPGLYLLQFERDGWFSVESASDAVDLALYDVDRRLLASSRAVNGKARLDYDQARAGQTCLLDLLGDSTGVSLVLANLVTPTSAGIEVFGTSQTDDFFFNAAEGWFSINGLEYPLDQFAVGARGKVAFTGRGSGDEAGIMGTSGSDRFELYPQATSTWTGGGLTVELSGVKTIDVQAGGPGRDAAILHDTTALDRMTAGLELTSQTDSQNTYYAYLHGFRTIDARAEHDQYEDVAVFGDSPNKDLLVARPRLADQADESGSYSFHAAGFGTFIGRSQAGGNDAAVLQDSAARDIYQGTDTVGQLARDGEFLTRAEGYYSIQAIASSAEDVAQVAGWGTNEQATIRLGSVSFMSGSLTHRLTSFNNVRLSASSGAQSLAVFHSSLLGIDQFTGKAGSSQLQGTYRNSPASVRATNFRLVRAYAASNVSQARLEMTSGDLRQITPDYRGAAYQGTRQVVQAYDYRQVQFAVVSASGSQPLGTASKTESGVVDWLLGHGWQW